MLSCVISSGGCSSSSSSSSSRVLSDISGIAIRDVHMFLFVDMLTCTIKIIMARILMMMSNIITGSSIRITNVTDIVSYDD